MNNIELLTVEEVANCLRISRDRMYEIVRSGAIRSFRVGRLIRIDRADLLAYMENQRQRATIS